MKALHWPTKAFKNGLETIRSHVAMAQAPNVDQQHPQLRDQVVGALRECNSSLLIALLVSDSCADGYRTNCKREPDWSVFDLLDSCKQAHETWPGKSLTIDDVFKCPAGDLAALTA